MHSHHSVKCSSKRYSKKKLENLILLVVEGSMTGNLESGINIYKPLACDYDTSNSSGNLDVAHTQILINDLSFLAEE